MGETLSQLGHLFVQSIPTVVFVFLLLVILDRLLFRPLTKVLQQREEATTGALALARERAAAAKAKAAEYEAAFQAARQEAYRFREADRRAALAERESALNKARQQADAWLKDAQAAIAAQVEAAKQQLAGTYRSLAMAITQAVLGEGPTASRQGGPQT